MENSILALVSVYCNPEALLKIVFLLQFHYAITLRHIEKCELSCLSCLVHSHMLVPAVTFSPQAPRSADPLGTAEVVPH